MDIALWCMFFFVFFFRGLEEIWRTSCHNKTWIHEVAFTMAKELMHIVEHNYTYHIVVIYIIYIMNVSISILQIDFQKLGTSNMAQKPAIIRPPPILSITSYPNHFHGLTHHFKSTKPKRHHLFSSSDTASRSCRSHLVFVGLFSRGEVGPLATKSGKSYELRTKLLVWGICHQQIWWSPIGFQCFVCSGHQHQSRSMQFTLWDDLVCYMIETCRRASQDARVLCSFGSKGRWHRWV